MLISLKNQVCGTQKLKNIVTKYHHASFRCLYLSFNYMHSLDFIPVYGETFSDYIKQYGVIHDSKHPELKVGDPPLKLSVISRFSFAAQIVPNGQF